MKNLTLVAVFEPQQYLEHNVLDFIQTQNLVREKYFFDVFLFKL